MGEAWKAWLEEVAAQETTDARKEFEVWAARTTLLKLKELEEKAWKYDDLCK